MNKNILKLILFVAMIQLVACKDSDDPSNVDAQVTMLTTKTWGQATVMHGTDGDLSDQYTDFAITFSNSPSGDYLGTYLVANGSHAFSDASGKWKFNEDKTLIIFDSGREIEFELTDTHLTLDFTVPESGGRANGLSGHFTFELTPM